MLFWSLATVMTVIVCAALYYAAAGGEVNASTATLDDSMAGQFRLQLADIERDIASGELPASEGDAAKAELAREMIRQRRDVSSNPSPSAPPVRVALPLSIVAVAAIAFGAYAYLGNPGIPSQPLAGRTPPATDMQLDTAVKSVEDHLAAHPEDLKGWQVMAPIYMQTAQYPKAEHAFRQILALAPETADADTDLAQLLMVENGGQAVGEPGTLLQKARTLDPSNVRARFYLAAEAMRVKDYPSAVSQWGDLVGMGTDADSWMPTAKAALAAAQAGRDGRPLPSADTTPAAQSPAIAAMVAGLADRLNKEGGALADWTKLVRSEIVLGDLAKAQSAYDSARRAYPYSGDRAELDSLAAQAGLKIDGTGK